MKRRWWFNFLFMTNNTTVGHTQTCSIYRTRGMHKLKRPKKRSERKRTAEGGGSQRPDTEHKNFSPSLLDGGYNYGNPRNRIQRPVVRCVPGSVRFKLPGTFPYPRRTSLTYISRLATTQTKSNRQTSTKLLMTNAVRRSSTATFAGRTMHSAILALSVSIS